MKLGRLVSFSGLLWCYSSSGSGMSSGSGGCRRQAVAAAEVRRGGELEKEKGSGNADA
jgi:hypothetical protein